MRRYVKSTRIKWQILRTAVNMHWNNLGDRWVFLTGSHLRSLLVVWPWHRLKDLASCCMCMSGARAISAIFLELRVVLATADSRKGQYTWYFYCLFSFWKFVRTKLYPSLWGSPSGCEHREYHIGVSIENITPVWEQRISHWCEHRQYHIGVTRS